MRQLIMPLNSRLHGFTLVELSIVLLIISLLASGLMMTVSAQMEQRYRSETQQSLAEAREALLGFAATHSATNTGKPYLPCPNSDGTGTEGPRGASGQCTQAEGMLPWSDLGVARQDSWNNRLRYRVAQSYTDRNNGFNFTPSAPTDGVLRICEQATCSSTLATNIPALILSHGPNGLGATNLANLANPSPASADEKENTDGDTDFVWHTPTPAGPDEFDDVVIWLSPNTLYNRLIAAGRLP